MLETLAASGLSLLAKVGLAKGKEWLKEKTGVDLDKESLSSEDLLALKKYELDNEKELLQITLDYEKSESQEVTKRLQADMSSDSWLSKNVRPTVLVAVTLFVAFSIALPESYIGADRFSSVTELALWVYGFYFGVRSVFDKGTLANVVGKLKK